MNKTTNQTPEAQAAMAQARFDALLAISAFSMASLARESRASGTKVNKRTAAKCARDDGADVMYDLARLAAANTPGKANVIGARYWRRARSHAKVAADLAKKGD